MKKYNLISLFILFIVFNTYADLGDQCNKNFIKEIISAKQNFQNNLRKSDMPVSSTWIKSGMKAEHIKANVKGLKKLVLITNGGPDGNSWDHAVWGNPRLTRKDGTVVFLDEVKLEYGNAGWGKPVFNKNLNNKIISIAKKSFEKSVFCHSDGILVFNIDGNFDTFEAEVGIDDNSASGSVYFIILNDDPSNLSNIIGNKYPNEFAIFNNAFGDIEKWFLDASFSKEQEAFDKILSQLKDKSYFESLRNDIVKSNSNISYKYLDLIYDIRNVKLIQDQISMLNVSSVKDAYEDMCSIDGYQKEKYSSIFNEFIILAKNGFDGIYKNDKLAFSNARNALKLKRELLLSNPLLNNDKIIATKFVLGKNALSAMSPSLGTQYNNWSTQISASRGGFNASIVELSNLKGDINERTIYKPENTSSIADLKLHWDGSKVMFSQVTDDNRWNVHEVKIDGTDYKKLIDNEEPDLDFFDATYLPDGRIIATSNIGYQGVPCVNGSDPVGNMVIYDPANRNLRRITFDQESSWNPVIMNNGRLMYTRWEYTDLTHYYSRIVMHMNPDGTENKALYGSGAMFPNSTFDIQPLPGHGSAFVGIISGHHGVARSGRMILFDPSKGRKSIGGMTQEIPYRNRPIKELIKDELVNGVWPQFIKPMPINDKYFLVSAKPTSSSLWGIYLVDIFDNMTCLYEHDGEGFISPILLRNTPTPPVIPDRVKLNEKEATFFIQDIYEGEGLKGIPRGVVKEVRLFAYEYAYVNTPSDHNWQGIQSGWDIKRLLGTVPVQEDGSVIFKAPANTPISIQPLDEEGVAVQWMRSWVTGQPGEIVSCVGCHEDQNQIAMPKRVMASRMSPLEIKKPEGGVRSFTFDLEIQPILDRNCISCHNENGKTFNLVGGEKDRHGYGKSYLNLHPYVHRQGGEGDMPVLNPYEYHPNTSELVRLIKNGHYNVNLSDKEWRTLYNWIDFNAPDKGYFDAYVQKNTPFKGFEQIERRIELNNKYASGAGVDWKQELKNYAEFIKTNDEKKTVVLSSKDKKYKDLKLKNWPFEHNKNDNNIERKIVSIAPGIDISFVKIPQGEFIMGNNLGKSNEKPTSKVKIKKSFWMAELETTNQQFNVVFPEHDSRYMDQQWKDHVVPGYKANEPHQPVIRVSYNQVMEYCQRLSEKTGLNITLPTEAQWEWACRAGTDSDFWYGNMNSDFGTKENLADKTTLQFAVSGVDPKPMNANDPWYKYYTYLPKEENVDDGCLIQIAGKRFESNPFGLYNMHGNVSEWTRSDYVNYPYKDDNKLKSNLKVVRGGSFIDRPKYSTSYERKGYYPYQGVYNVGFRMIIEE